MATLDVPVATVCQLIELAREFHAQGLVDIGEAPSDMEDDWPSEMLSAHAANTTLEAFRATLDDLGRYEQAQVVALMWLGRGDYTPEDWASLQEDAESAWTPRTADYLLAHPLLAEHLTDGLELFGYSCD